MTSLRVAAQQALEALHEIGWSNNTRWQSDRAATVIPALRAALAEPVQQPVWVCPDSAEHRYGKPGHCEDCGKTLVQVAEPVQESVAWLWEHQLNDLKHYGYRPDMRAWTTEKRLGSFEGLVPLYTAPLQRKPLSDEDIEKAYRHIYRNLSYEFDHSIASWVEQGIRYAERAHGIKDA